MFTDALASLEPIPVSHVDDDEEESMENPPHGDGLPEWDRALTEEGEPSVSDHFSVGDRKHDDPAPVELGKEEGKDSDGRHDEQKNARTEQTMRRISSLLADDGDTAEAAVVLGVADREDALEQYKRKQTGNSDGSDLAS